MANEWDNAEKQALKILGDKGKIPDPKLKSYNEAAAKAWNAFDKARDDIEAKLTDLEGAFEKISSAIDQYEAKLEKDNLGLNPKDKDEAKKIDQAKDILLAEVKTTEKAWEDEIKDLKEVARHVIQLGKYKPSTDVG
jgi:predicted  nucleic acid-binding Zn-ribbon protein